MTATMDREQLLAELQRVTAQIAWAREARHAPEPAGLAEVVELSDRRRSEPRGSLLSPVGDISTTAEVSAMADTSDSVGGGRFDVRPLVDRAGGVMALARLVGCSRGVVHRAAHGAGVRLVEADAWSCALGLHPAEVWGDLWWDAVAV